MTAKRKIHVALRGALVTLVVLIVGLAGAIIFGTAPAPPPLTSIGAPFTAVDYSDLPPTQTYAARDGTPLAYRTYPGGAERIAVIVHGSSAHSASLHPLAKTAQGAGYTVFTLDMRGHGASGPHGDIAFIGQLDDDIADLMAFLRKKFPNARATLMGFSSGGGFALRIAGAPDGGPFDRYILISPALPYNAPTIRPGTGGWAAPYIPRIVALTILNRFGIHWFDGLPALAFAVRANDDGTFVANYSFRLMQNFAAMADFRENIRRVTRPMTVLVGSADQLFFADQFAPLFQSIRTDIPITVIPELGHTEMSVRPEALAAIAAALAD